MWRRLFVDHPKSVGETYFEHQSVAFSFGSAMIVSGLACLVHGLAPGLFVRTGSKTVATLYDRMVVNRAKQTPHLPLEPSTASPKV